MVFKNVSRLPFTVNKSYQKPTKKSNFKSNFSAKETQEYYKLVLNILCVTDSWSHQWRNQSPCLKLRCG